MERHGCKVCGLSFPSGRSLGGHMRSHVAVSSCLEVEEKGVGRYRLRENPRKSWRLCEGKGFGSWNSPFEDMKCCSQITRDDLNEVEEEEETLESNDEEMGSQSYSEVTAIEFPARRRRMSRWVAAISAAASQPEEYEKEQAYGAFCLLMLSRGAGSVKDSSDKIPLVFEKDWKSSESDFPAIVNRMNVLKRDQSLHSESGFSCDDDQDVNFSSESLDQLPDTKKNLNSAVAESKKRCRYECATCNKSFSSYQALGGHRASHKKIKGASFQYAQTEELELHNYCSQTSERQPGKSRDHECSICLKVFGSGQALGGHKRSHLVASYNTTAADDGVHDYQKASKLSLLDLNLPAPDDESSYNSNGSIEC